MRKVVVLSNNKGNDAYQYEIEQINKLGDAEFIVAPTTDADEAIPYVRDAEVILFTATKINESFVSKLEKCKLIIRYGIGYDNVDLKATAERGIFVCNSPNYGVIDVAEHALSLMLAAAKKTSAMAERVKMGKWGSDGTPFIRLGGKTIGFIGFGNIGKALCKMINGLGMRPIVYDPFVSNDVLEEYGAEKIELDELLVEADFVSLHLPLNDSTRHMISKETFKKMKSSAILINTSRGPIVDEAALIEALEAGQIAGVGLDVFENETVPVDERLANSPRAVLTPHVAWNTDTAVVALHKEVGDNVVRYLKGERPHSIVNGL